MVPLRSTLPLVLAGGLALVPAAARADSIDGHWCTDTGLRMTIQGQNLVSPGGVRISGDYGRHDFSYVAPAGEPGGGGRVDLRLMGENAVRAQAASGAIEPLWRRCGPPVS
jgi:hypothetical protein